MMRPSTYTPTNVSTYVTMALVTAEPIGVRQVPTNGSRIPKTEYPIAWQIGPIAANGIMYPV